MAYFNQPKNKTPHASISTRRLYKLFLATTYSPTRQLADSTSTSYPKNNSADAQ